MTFLETYKIALTPLSPIHIGCGEDFEPTNYVIDAEQKVLYGFDPSLAVLSEAKAKELSSLGEKGNLMGIQKFFRDNQDVFRPHSQVLIPVSVGVATDYKNKIGRVANVEINGNQVFNKFTIERHIHSRNTPYIPGSSLKGALRTAMMDRLNNGAPVLDKDEVKNSVKLAKRLFDGDFATTPMRLIKIGDLISDQWLGREVVYAVNRHKRPKVDARTQNQRNPRGVTARKESIQLGQYRALRGEISFQKLQGKGSHTGRNPSAPAENQMPSLQMIVRDCNKYHLSRFRKELQAMDEKSLLNPDWVSAIRKLMQGGLKSKLEQGKAFLVRLGRYGGAENKTLSEVARIKIMGQIVDERQQFNFLPETFTYWFAAENANDHKHMLPFGWALVEIDPEEDFTELKAWCEQTARNHPDMREKYAALAQAKSAAESAAAQQRAEREAQQEKERQAAESEAKAKAEREKQLAAMSEAGRKIEAYKEACATLEQSLGGRKDTPYGAAYQKAKTLADAARAGADWNADQKNEAADAIEHWLPRLETLQPKDVRKKLKLAELRGTPT